MLYTSLVLISNWEKVDYEWNLLVGDATLLFLEEPEDKPFVDRNLRQSDKSQTAKWQLIKHIKNNHEPNLILGYIGLQISL